MRVKVEFDLPDGTDLSEYRASLVVYRNWNPEKINDSYSFINIRMEEKKKNDRKRKQRKSKKLGRGTETDSIHASDRQDKVIHV